MTERAGNVWRIRPGRRDDYLRMHAAIWPELKSLLREAGVTSYTIYVQNDTVFSHLEAEDYDRLVERVAGEPISERWEAQFADILEYPNADPQNGWPERLTEVWHLLVDRSLGGGYDRSKVTDSRRTRAGAPAASRCGRGVLRVRT